jgi:hypothetical protein
VAARSDAHDEVGGGDGGDVVVLGQLVPQKAPQTVHGPPREMERVPDLEVGVVSVVVCPYVSNRPNRCRRKPEPDREVSRVAVLIDVESRAKEARLC